MTVLDDSDYVVVKEYILFLKDELVDIFFDEQEIRSICTKTNCQIELTNRILNRKIGGFKIIKYAIIQIKGKDDFSIRQCNRLLEQRCPHYRQRQEYNKKAYCCTIFPEEALPDNAQLYFQYQRSGATKYQFGKVLLKSPFETNYKRPLNDCYWKTNDCDLKKGILVSSTKQTENYFSRYLKNNLSSQEPYKDEPYSNLYFENPVEDEEPNKPLNKGKPICKLGTLKSGDKNYDNDMHKKNMRSEVQIDSIDDKDGFGKSASRTISFNEEAGHQFLQYEMKQTKDDNSLMIVNTFQLEKNSPVNESYKPLIDVLVIEEYSEYNNVRDGFGKGGANINLPQTKTASQQRLQQQRYVNPDGQNEMNVDIVENIQYNDATSSIVDINFAVQALNNVDDIYTLNVQDYSVANKYDQTSSKVIVENSDINNKAQTKVTPSNLTENIILQDESNKNIIQKEEKLLKTSYLDSLQKNDIQIYMQNIITMHPYSDVTKDTLIMNKLPNNGENVIIGNAAMITQKILLAEDGGLTLDHDYERLDNIESEGISHLSQVPMKTLNSNDMNESKLSDKSHKSSLTNDQIKKSDRLSLDDLRKSPSKSSRSSIISTTNYSKLNKDEKSHANDKSIIMDEAQYLARLPIHVQNTFETSELPSTTSPEFRVLSTATPEFRVPSTEQFGNVNLENTENIPKLHLMKGSKTTDSSHGSQASQYTNNKIKVRYQVKENGKIIEDRILDEMHNESRIYTDSQSIQLISDNKNAPGSKHFNDDGRNSSFLRFNANLNDKETSSIHFEMVIKDTYKQYLNELPISKTEADIESPQLEIPYDNTFRTYDSTNINEAFNSTNKLAKKRSPQHLFPGYESNITKGNIPSDPDPKKMAKCFSFTKEKKSSKNGSNKLKNNKDKIEKYEKHKVPNKLSPIIHTDGSRDTDLENIKENRRETKINNQNNRKFDRSKKQLKINDSTNLEVILMSVNSDEETLCELSGSQIISDISNNAHKSTNSPQRALWKQSKENPALETLTKFNNLSGMDLLVQQMADRLLVDISCLSNDNLNYPEIKEIDSESQSSETMFSMNFEIPIKNNQNSMKVTNNNSKKNKNHQLLDTSMLSDISSFTYHPESRSNFKKHSFTEEPLLSPNSFLNNNFSNSTDCFPILLSKYFDELNLSQGCSYDDFLPLVNINKLKWDSNLQFADILCTDRQFPSLESTNFFQTISELKRFLNDNLASKQNYSIDKIYQCQILYRVSETYVIGNSNPEYIRNDSEKLCKRTGTRFIECTNEIFHIEYRKPIVEVVFENNSIRLFHQFPKIHDVNINTTHSLRYYQGTSKLVSPRILYKYKPDGNSKIPKLNKAMKQVGPISLFHEEFLNSTTQLEFYKNKSQFIPNENKIKDHTNNKKESNPPRITSTNQSHAVTCRLINDLNSENVLLTNAQYESSFSKITDWILRNNKYARG